MSTPRSPAPLRRPPRLAALLVLASVAPGQSEPFDPAAALRRCRWIAAGEYQRSRARIPEPEADDVVLCAQALAHDDVPLRQQACFAAAALVRQRFFAGLPQERRRALVLPVIGLLASDDADLADASAQALGQFAAVDGVLEERDARSAIVQALALVLLEDVEARRRAGLLLEKLVRAAGESSQQQVARTVLLALDRYPRGADEGERAAVARTTLQGVLARLQVRDQQLADELAARFLADLQGDLAWGFHYARGDATLGLGRTFAALAGDRRAAALAALRAAIGDPRLQYMRTSGRRTPFRHHGHEALALAAPALALDEVAAVAKEATAAREAAAASGCNQEDLAGMYDDLQAALAARAKALGK
jgi:hypothetical protein